MAIKSNQYLLVTETSPRKDRSELQMCSLRPHGSIRYIFIFKRTEDRESIPNRRNPRHKMFFSPQLALARGDQKTGSLRPHQKDWSRTDLPSLDTLCLLPRPPDHQIKNPGPRIKSNGSRKPRNNPSVD